MNILIFLVVLVVLIVVHELGHFIVAKLVRMRVDEFGIGFPPRLFGIRKGETVYSLNALPIGGFVKIFGEDSQIEGRSDTRAFISKSKWAQTAVLFAGVAMNVLLAWVIFVVIFATGIQTAVSEGEASENAGLMVADVLDDSPAERAGIPAGVHIEALQSGEDTLVNLTPTAFQQFIEMHGNNSLTVTYNIGGETLTTMVMPATDIVPNAPEQSAIGISLALVDVVAEPLPVAVYEATILTGTLLRDITVGISGLLWDALRLEADFSQVAGPIGIVGLVGEASAFGFSALLMFTAFISLNLAIINLLPFPALDGGRLLFVVIEAVKGSPINPSWVSALNTAGFALLILLMVAVTFNDVARII